MKSQEQMLQATNAAAEAMKDLTDAGARKEQIQGAERDGASAQKV